MLVQRSATGVDDAPNLSALRAQVRSFLATAMQGVSAKDRANSWTAFDPAFSRNLGKRGWIGMTWPTRYGGRDCDIMERFTVTEELLAAGAPVGAHWIADRQSGPLLLRYGTEEQRQRYLPAIARGELYFCIGMSESAAGSDLAAVKTHAVRDAAGWRINGQKIWTTNAHKAHIIIALVRTDSTQTRQAGLSQFLIDLSSLGVTVRPIEDMTGASHFNEIFFEDVHVPSENLIGEAGGGWAQVMSELALERSGPERYLSSIQAILQCLQVIGLDPDEPLRSIIGRAAAELWTLRQMSRNVARRIQAGEDPMVDACIVKDMGNTFEQEIPRIIQANVAIDEPLAGDTELGRVLALLLQTSPSFSLRGGTREILRGIIARGIGLR